MDRLTSVSSGQNAETELVHFLIDYAEAQQLPLAFWRLPNTTTKQLLLSNHYQSVVKGSSIEDLPTGFMFAPFDKNKDALFLPADYFFAFADNQLKTSEHPLDNHSRVWLNHQIETKGKATPKRNLHTSPPSGSSTTDYHNLVSKSIKAIEAGHFEKVVASRTKEVQLRDDFDVIETFNALCERYPNALVSFVSIPGVGSWLGATPETLVSVENNSVFKTVALAGTLPYREGMDLRAVSWTQKEIEEQALVERYIISCFKKIRLREYDEYGPKSVVAGNLVHLKSDFVVDMKATNFPQLGTVMLQLLHPTSAVCGMPLEPSFNFLKENEGYDREFYSGYLGPVNVDQHIHLYVNLRCMKLIGSGAVLYAGAGITVDSIPEKEWEETEMKFRTLLNVIS